MLASTLLVSVNNKIQNFSFAGDDASTTRATGQLICLNILGQYPARK